jgi:uncharacterized membrane protein YkvA (DUF1232 family)
MKESLENNQSQKTPLKSFGVFLLGIIGLIYILNPTAGFFELIPDNLPFIGNLDEAGAIMLVLGALRYFGIDLLKPRKRK